MKLQFGIALLSVLFAHSALANQPVPVGRWEIVHTSGDSTAQTDLFPGGFSTYLYADGTGNSADTSANSICVVNEPVSTVVPTWTSLGENRYQITVVVNNNGLGPNSTFIYTGKYSAETAVPGDSSLKIRAIIGTYYTTGDASACSTATQAAPGNFVATFFPDLVSGSAKGTLDNADIDGVTPFDSDVNAKIDFSAPPSPGQIAGTVSLATNPTISGSACFATTMGVPNKLNIDSSQSNTVGILNTIYAQGLDSVGNPTTLVLQGYSANMYTTNNNTDPTANEITSTEWAAAAAIGEDNPDLEGIQGIGIQGVESDGTNKILDEFYSVVGGVCDGANGSDSPFFVLSGHRRGEHRRYHVHDIKTPRGNT